MLRAVNFPSLQTFFQIWLILPLERHQYNVIMRLFFRKESHSCWSSFQFIGEFLIIKDGLLACSLLQIIFLDAGLFTSSHITLRYKTSCICCIAQSKTAACGKPCAPCPEKNGCSNTSQQFIFIHCGRLGDSVCVRFN